MSFSGSQGARQEERCESNTRAFRFPEHGSLSVCRRLLVQMLDEKQIADSLGVSLKLNTHPTCDPEVILLDIYPGEMKAHVHKKNKGLDKIVHNSIIYN